MAGTGEGIARYVEELVKHSAIIDNTNEYFLIYSDQFSILNSQFPNNFKIIKTETPYYSFAEQTRFVGELKSLKLDLMHFPSFNVPIFYPGKFVVTIHDIIHHLYPGKKKSRWFHRLAYRLVINSAVRRASKIITVSKATRDDILKTFNIHNSPPSGDLPEGDKIQVIYEGVGDKYWEKMSNDKIRIATIKYGITKPYILFVGVWRQYKNLERLARAFDILKERHRLDYQLVMAGKIDPFYPEIKKAVLGIKYSYDIKALGHVPDEDLPALYQGASVFVLPSLLEGFGLIGVEAQASGVPVAASDIPVLREVLGEGAVYFDAQNPNAMANIIEKILRDSDLESRLVEQGLRNAKKYDWSKTAMETLEIYKKA